MEQREGNVECFSLANAYRFGDALAEHHRFRYRCFIERLGYRVLSHDGMEYDQYDTLTALYLSYRSREGRVLGCCRFVPTTGAYMLADQWPGIVTEIPLPRSPQVLEGTRLGVEETLGPRQRALVFNTLVVGLLELAGKKGATQIIAVATPELLRMLQRHLGGHLACVGEAARLADGVMIRPILLEISSKSLMAVRRSTGIDGSVISMAEDLGP